MPDQALSGLRVVDLSESIAGQYCARLLADHGAEVTLLEPPQGSELRKAEPMSTERPGWSLLFHHLNTGKASVCLDGDTPTGSQAFSRLCAAADVVLLPAGLDPAAVAAINPRCVTASITPFGQ